MTDEERLQGMVRGTRMLMWCIREEERHPLTKRPGFGRGTFRQGYLYAITRIKGYPWLDELDKWIEEIRKEHPEWDDRFFGNL